MKQSEPDFDIELFDEQPDTAEAAEAEEASAPVEADKDEQTPDLLPLNFLRFGEVARDDVKVYIRQAVYKAIEKFAKSDTSRELGSILVGTVSEQLGTKQIIITNAIEAKYTDASASTLTFTHETWADVHRKMEQNYPDKKILGWQHTHPGYGIFLSNYDMFIQENFFDLPFQVAYVVDPVQNLRGFFQWKNGEVQKLDGYYVYDEVGKSIRIEAPKEKKPVEEKKDTDSHRGWLIALSALAAALAVFCGILFAQIRQLRQSQQELSDGLAASKAEAAAGQSEISSLLGRIADMEAAAADQQEMIDKMQQQLNERDGQPRFIRYTVQAGDSIYRICEKNDLPFFVYKDVIRAINGLDGNYTIHPGQVLWIPASGT